MSGLKSLILAKSGQGRKISLYRCIILFLTCMLQTVQFPTEMMFLVRFANMTHLWLLASQVVFDHAPRPDQLCPGVNVLFAQPDWQGRPRYASGVMTACEAARKGVVVSGVGMDQTFAIQGFVDGALHQLPLSRVRIARMSIQQP